MIRICPNPIAWNQTFERLTEHATRRLCVPASPPAPLILAGWAYTNDVEKRQRWEETVAWANANGCAEIINEIADSDYYAVENPSAYIIGPLGGPMYRPWDYSAKARPKSQDLNLYLDALVSRWPEIVGADLARATRPIAFSGRKARSLLVFADADVRPPWGDWLQLSALESERRTFTVFRSAINKAITPHEIDHVEFSVGRQRV
ncbi:MAG: DUF721 domain-containing protein [Pseudorhodoplanes sp.]|nr:DUF721 domain-containing protein [Pseudorhodoplanes sp.]